MMEYSKKNRQAADKYYTKPEVASKCWGLLKAELEKRDIKDYCIIEPCAGDGKLMDAVDCEVYGFDLYPERKDIVKNDFLANPNIPYEVETDKVKVTFANPPFGSKGKLCKAFIDEALKHSPVVGFILPRSFLKYCSNYNVVSYEWLDNYGFTYAGEDYPVNCIFAIIQKEGKGISIELPKLSVKPNIQPVIYNTIFVKEIINDKITKLKSLL